MQVYVAFVALAVIVVNCIVLFCYTVLVCHESGSLSGGLCCLFMLKLLLLLLSSLLSAI